MMELRLSKKVLCKPKQEIYKRISACEIEFKRWLSTWNGGYKDVAKCNNKLLHVLTLPTAIVVTSNRVK